MRMFLRGCCCPWIIVFRPTRPVSCRRFQTGDRSLKGFEYKKALMQKAHLPHFRPVSALLVSRRAVAMSADSSNRWMASSFSAILLSFSATILSFSATISSIFVIILSFSTILSLNSLTEPKYQPTIWKKQIIYKLSNTQQGLTILSNKLTSFDCCGLRSTRRDETARTCDRMTDIPSG